MEKPKEKLTEKLNAITVSKSLKESIIKIATDEEIQIQQACRKLLTNAINDYFSKKKKKLVF
jgi:propanediol dehydratase small subunit